MLRTFHISSITLIIEEISGEELIRSRTAFLDFAASETLCARPSLSPEIPWRNALHTSEW